MKRRGANIPWNVLNYINPEMEKVSMKNGCGDDMLELISNMV